MEEYEMNLRHPNVCMTSSQSIETESNNCIVFTSICRRCNEDTSKGELIRPCECTGDQEFMHIHCLESMANLRKQSYCTFCNAAFPLEIKYKPFIEIYRDSKEKMHLYIAIGTYFFILLGAVIYNIFMVILIGNLLLSILQTKEELFFENIIAYSAVMILIIFFISIKPYEAKFLENTFNNLSRVHSQWLVSIQERKVKKSLIREN